MECIRIVSKKETKSGWEFIVEVGTENHEIGYRVTVEKESWQKLAYNRFGPEELVYRTFQFLLKRQPKGALFRSFSLREAAQQFPAYEEKMKKRQWGDLLHLLYPLLKK